MHFLPFTHDHLPMLTDWLARPHVAAWWSLGEPPPDLATVTADYGDLVEGADGGTSARGWIASLAGTPIGFIQSYVAVDTHADGWWLDVTDPGVRGIDLFLADGERLGQGLGTAMVRAFVRQLFDDPAVTWVQTDPAPHNARAIACYRRAGFGEVGPVDTPDGPALYMVCDRPLVTG